MENTEVEYNVKTLYRPFKRCFKYPTNTVTKWIWNVINYHIYKKTAKTKHSNSHQSRGSTMHRQANCRYASIKGYCGLNKNGYLR